MSTHTAADGAWGSAGLLGLGAMGGAMARRLLGNGWSLTVYDPLAERLAACVALGARAAQGVSEIVQSEQYVLASLRSSATFVEAAERDLLPNAWPGQVFIDLGTTEASETRRLAAALAARGAELVDAPVSGGPAGAESGTLRVFVGGSDSAVRRCMPILSALGAPGRVVHCGPSGAGQIVKGVNQLTMGLGSAAYLEALAYGVRAGVDLAAISQAVGGDQDWRATLAAIAQQISDGAPEAVYTKFPELPYYLNEAHQHGAALPLTEALHAFLDPAPREWLDNMGRPTVSFWYRLLRDGATGAG